VHYEHISIGRQTVGVSSTLSAINLLRHSRAGGNDGNRLRDSLASEVSCCIRTANRIAEAWWL